MDWRDEAACLDEDPELFFPIGETGPAVSQIGRAKQVCRRCSSILPCLELALETGADGIWGGLDDRDRDALRRQGRTRVA